MTHIITQKLFKDVSESGLRSVFTVKEELSLVVELHCGAASGILAWCSLCSKTN